MSTPTSKAPQNNALERTRRVGVPRLRGAIVRVSPRRSTQCYTRAGSGQRLVLGGLLLVTLLAGACSDDAGYQEYASEAFAQLTARQEQLKTEYKLGNWERFDWDQERQELVFSHQGKPVVVAGVQFVGSFSTLSNTWRWAWANDTILPGMRAGSERVKKLGEERGWDRLTEPQWPATEEDGWEMTGVALRALDAKGAYRSPDENGLTFMVITSIRWANGVEGGV